MTRTPLALLALGAMVFFALGEARAARPEPGDPEVARIEQHLNATRTMTADFSQVGPDGSLSSGRFFLSRPGKFRWSYDPPVPILIIGNGNTMAYYDFELDEVSHVSMDRSLAGLLARKDIRFFGGDVEVVDLTREAEVLRLTVIQKGKADEGRLTLVFADNPIDIRKLEVTDATGEVTHISLNNVRYGMPLENSLFSVDTTPAYPRRKRN